MDQFIHLHTHSDFSLLRGSSSIDKLIDKAIELKMPALALTDRGNMYGVMEFLNKVKNKNAQGISLKAIVGIEIFLSESSRFDSDNSQVYTLVLLAENYRGYLNLVKLSSISFKEGLGKERANDMPVIDWETLSRYSSDIICLTSGLDGAIYHFALQGNESKARSYLNKLKNIFSSGQLYLEIQNHELENDLAILSFIEKLSLDSSVPMVASNEVHYANSEDALANEILMAIGNENTIEMEKESIFKKDRNSGKRPVLPANNFHLRSSDEMALLFTSYIHALENTLVISQKCQLERPQQEPHMPIIDLKAGMNIEQMLEHDCLQGLKVRGIEITNKYRERLNYELEVIKKMGFPDYFFDCGRLYPKCKKKMAF